jgi:hypothetical protein
MFVDNAVRMWLKVVSTNGKNCHCTWCDLHLHFVGMTNLVLRFAWTFFQISCIGTVLVTGGLFLCTKVESTTFLIVLIFSQHCSWGFRSSRMWHCVSGVIGSWCFEVTKMKSLLCLRTLGSDYPWMQHHIPEEPNPQPACMLFVGLVWVVLLPVYPRSHLFYWIYQWAVSVIRKVQKLQRWCYGHSL